jgi:tetratricopeptide (TPR) repeat protein
MLIALPTGSAREAAQRAAANVERLRAEHAATTEPELRARLSFELGLIEEELGNNQSAAEYFEAAVTANPTLREAGERLLALSEREAAPTHNLGAVLQSLLDSAGTLEEQQRALLLRAVHLVEHDRDGIGARALLEQWLAQHPNDVSAWLILEIIAAQLADTELRRDALSQRARCADDPLWRALLLIDVSRLQSASDQPEAAKRSLESILQTRTSATYRTLTALERLTRDSDEAAFVATLDARARLLTATLRGEIAGDSLGVPRSECSPSASAAATLLAAQANQQRGSPDRAAMLLDDALRTLPDDPLLLGTRLRLAEKLDQHEVVMRLAHRLLDLGASPLIGATLWLSIAEAARKLGQTEAAIAALGEAVTLNTECWLARAHLLALLADAGDDERLTQILEQGAALSTSSEAQAFEHFTAADLSARRNDPLAVERALSRAGTAGASAVLVGRVRRFLAVLRNDQDARLNATDILARLLDADRSEQRDLRLELLRERLLKAQPVEANVILDQLAADPSDATLVWALRSFPVGALANGGPTDSAFEDPLLRLAERESSTHWKRALRLVSAVRAQRRDELHSALDLVQRVRDDHSDDVLSVSYLSDLQAQQGQLLESVDTLSQAADGIGETEEKHALRVQAGLRAWRAGARQRARQELGRAVDEGADLPRSVLAWCDGVIAGDVPPENRAETPGNVPQAALHGDPQDQYEHLRRWAWASCSEGSSAQTTATLQTLEGSPLPVAALLAQALGTTERDTAGPGTTAPETARSALEKHCETPGSLTAATSYLEATERNLGLPDRLIAARRWAHSESSLAAACEWLALAHASRDRSQEAKALLHLATLLPSDEATAVADSGHLSSWLAGGELDAPKGSAPLHAESALPGARAAERATALEAVLGMFPADAAITQTLLGTNHLEAEQFADAELCFRAATQHDPHDVAAWDGLREVALKTDNQQLMAEALAALGDITLQPEAAGELWRRASDILLDTLGDQQRGKYALARAVELDPSHTDSYERLVGLVQRNQDSRWLVRLIDLRLTVAQSPQERVKLYWDKARAQRLLLDLDSALSTLDALMALEPEHLGALALSGEVHLARGEDALACDKLQALAAHNDAPSRQRLLSGLTAADLAARRLDDPARALEILRHLCASGIANVDVRERLVRLCVRLEQWSLALENLNELMLERADTEGRIAAARMAIAIHRDRLSDPAGASDAVQRLLREAPEDPEALDFVLSGALPEELTQQLLLDGQRALLQQLEREPEQVESVLRLATIAEALNDSAVRRAALGVAVALGHGTPQIEEALRDLDATATRFPKTLLTDEQLLALCDPEDRGPVAELGRLLAKDLAQVLGPNLKSLDLTKKDRLPANRLLVLAPEVLPWPEALGLTGIELFANFDRTEIQAFTDEGVLAFALPTNLQPKLDRMQLSTVARQALGVQLGTLALHHHPAAQIASLLSGLCAAAGHPLPRATTGAPVSVVEDLYDRLTRKTRKQLAELARKIAEGDHDPLQWALAAERSLDRVALLATGDASLVQATFPGGSRSAPPNDAAGLTRSRRLLAFALSSQYQRMQHELGLGAP